jgi:hypothetical protein
MWNRFIWLTGRSQDRLLWTRWINFPFPKTSTWMCSICSFKLLFYNHNCPKWHVKATKTHTSAWFWHSRVGIDLVWAALVSCNNYDGQISAFQSSRNEPRVCSHLIPSAGGWRAWFRESGDGADFIITSYVVSFIVFQYKRLEYRNGPVN